MGSAAKARCGGRHYASIYLVTAFVMIKEEDPPRLATVGNPMMSTVGNALVL